MQNVLIDDLKKQLAGGKTVAVIGAGISIGATDGNQLASWTGLLKDGVERCVELAVSDKDWAQRILDDVESPKSKIDDMLAAAERISGRLEAPRGGEYRRWLRETVGSLRLKKPDAIKALGEMGVVLATTNYD